MVVVNLSLHVSSPVVTEDPDCLQTVRNRLERVLGAKRALLETVARLAHRLLGCSLDSRFRRYVFTDAQTAAVKDHVAFGIGGFVGDEHLRTAIWTLHKQAPQAGFA